MSDTDPFAAPAFPSFPFARFRRAGATMRVAAELESVWNGLDQAVRNDAFEHIRTVADADLGDFLDAWHAAKQGGEQIASTVEAGAEQVAATVESTVAQSVETAKQVLERVGSDAKAAADALQVELSADKPRKTLVKDLQKIAATAAPQPSDEQDSAGDAPAAADVASSAAAGAVDAAPVEVDTAPSAEAVADAAPTVEAGAEQVAATVETVADGG